MSGQAVHLVAQGALVALAVVAALFFLRFWRTTRDRLFGFLAAAFALLASQWLLSALAPWAPDGRHYAYLVRLGAFVLIIVGIVDKNRHKPA